MSARSALIPYVDAIAGVRVLCVGDVMLDRFVHGRVERISPEAPIPVLRVERRAAMLGGAGNVVRNLCALGAEVQFVSVVGNDPAAQEIRALLEAEPRVRFSLAADRGRQTSVKTRYLAAGQQLLRADDECTEPLPETVATALGEAADAVLAECAIVVLSDYGKGVFAEMLAERLIEAAIAAGKPVVVDPKGREYGRYRGAHVITPNRQELAQAIGAAIPVGEETSAARRLIDDFGFGSVVVTLGRDGIVVIPATGETTRLPAEARDVFDVSGAGDTVVAALAATLAAGASVPEAAAVANVAAGIVVAKVGTAVARGSEVIQALRHQDLSQAESKIMEREAAADRVEVWRRQGHRIGFANGCFDLLHPGHVSLLAQARNACDRLIVGLNSDASVADLKGPDRPIQAEAARATVLASLATVDMVIVFGEETPLELIEALRPDVLVKGADYRIDQIVGADLVRGYGGEVLLARLEPGFSTSATARRIGKS